ncbi:BRO-N domain-containing protein [Desulfurivibrio alkaliphilus]|uniref:Bro-N domain-containing protein n=1 Tax=Desulfurivibrio alkaliphilus (strain DSM 19089 / UNIQEM U267 / AHT2) TaxID=589865 RepID=D6Z3V1_DESAT|nr:Bro-N domain-containing protein [Desulfurivibrio alkaliphilus]ADH86226.1 hypothetical protein DaAHT2_1531 [Desulfurivibrio alkaliphilus AHT 2]
MREKETLPIAFEGRKIRQARHEGEWWFAVEDVSGALTDQSDGAASWRQLQQSLEAEGCEVGTLCCALELPASDGRIRRTDCVTLEGIFRIVQSVSSPKAEIFKRWLARVAAEPVPPHGCQTNLDTVLTMLEDAACEQK